MSQRLIEQQRALGRLTRSELIPALDISESGFDRLGLEAAHREGRFAFYAIRDVAVALIARRLLADARSLRALKATNPAAARAAARAMAEQSLIE